MYREIDKRANEKAYSKGFVSPFLEDFDTINCRDIHYYYIFKSTVKSNNTTYATMHRIVIP
jgi:hypothetical protein